MTYPCLVPMLQRAARAASRSLKRAALVGVAGAAVVGAAPGARAADLAGRWSATAEVQGVAIPFRLDFRRQGADVRAVFYDGARPINVSAPAAETGDHVRLLFPSYAATLDLAQAGETLDGTYVKGRNPPIHIHAVRAGAPPASGGSAPAIAGEWIIPHASDKGEKAWRLIVRQTGRTAEATILRVDGDTGTLNGRYADGAFRLSHFAGERPALLVITPQPDGRLKLVLDDDDGQADLIGLRPAVARAQGVAPADPTHFTGVADPSQPFRFDFPDLQGHKVANTDPRFHGKVVIVDVMGSWCPNCHDETPFLESLYTKYHRQGLDIVALDFEQPDQLADPERLRAFVQRYGVTYTVLLAGAVKDVHEKLPQATNLAAWPTTFFLGRDGRVKATHVGFTSPGSGRRDAETKAEVEHEVQTLLAQPARS